MTLLALELLALSLPFLMYAGTARNDDVGALPVGTVLAALGALAAALR